MVGGPVGVVESLGNLQKKGKTVFKWSLHWTGDTSKVGWHMTYCISKGSELNGLSWYLRQHCC